MKYALFALTLTGCILSQDPKVIQKDHQVGPECLHEDSTTWTDTTETRHHSCVVDPKADPTDPKPGAPQAIFLPEGAH